MTINPDKCIKVTGRFHSTQGTVGDPALTNVVSGADEVYDDNYPLLVNGYVECDTTPISDPTGNPHEQGWCEEEVVGGEGTGKYILTEDTTVELGKSYYKPIGARQDAINNQLRTTINDMNGVVINADDVEKVITSEESKIINKEDGYVPTAGAVGRAMGANFEDNLQSTSTVKGLTANMGRVLNEKKADINGYYETMSVGSAKNLDGEDINEESYLIRPTGGAENEVANGVASVLGMEGNNAVWNQLLKHGNFDALGYWKSNENNINIENNKLTSTWIGYYSNNGIYYNNDFFVAGHKYYISVYLKNLVEQSRTYNLGLAYKFSSEFTFQGNQAKKISIIITATSDTGSGYKIGIQGSITVTNSIELQNFICIDLTLLGIDNLTTTAQVEEWLAQHVGTKPYYAYNPGTILSANTLGFKTYGQNLLNPTTKQAKLIPYTWEENSNVYIIKNVPSGATATFTPDATGVAETVDISGGSLNITSYGSGILKLSAATANTYVCKKWDGTKDNDVVPYEDRTYDFDVKKVYGKVSGEGEYVQCFHEGLRKVSNTVYDTLSANKATKVVLDTDLGNWNWAYTSAVSGWVLQANLPYAPIGYAAISSKYPYKGAYFSVTDKAFGYVYNTQLIVKDSSYPSSTTTSTEFKEAMTGVKVLYQRSSPIIYTDLIYRDGGTERPLREVLVNLNVDNWSMEEQLITDYDEQGNPTSVPATIQTKYSIDAVEEIKTLKEITYTETEVRAIFGNLLECINENCSSVLGGTFAIDPEVSGKTLDFTFTENASTNSTEENTETI